MGVSGSTIERSLPVLANAATRCSGTVSYASHSVLFPGIRVRRRSGREDLRCQAPVYSGAASTKVAVSIGRGVIALEMTSPEAGAGARAAEDHASRIRLRRGRDPRQYQEPPVVGADQVAGSSRGPCAYIRRRMSRGVNCQARDGGEAEHGGRPAVPVVYILAGTGRRLRACIRGSRTGRRTRLRRCTFQAVAARPCGSPGGQPRR